MGVFINAYQGWKGMAQECPYRKTDDDRPHKGSSRGKGVYICGQIMNKRCEMSGCPRRSKQ